MQKDHRRIADAARKADVALFYYAGHGFQVGGQNYLVPTDAAISRADQATTQTIAMSDILRVMATAPG